MKLKLITTSELLRRYAAGERDFSQSDIADLPENDLTGAKLAGVDLSNSFICCSFEGADLHGASFRDSNVKTCVFSFADLQDADFTEAAICGATFQAANMMGAKFDGADYYGIRLEGTELQSGD